MLIEFQRDWLAPDGKINRLMTDRHQFEGAVSAAAEALDVARSVNLRIAHTGLRFSPGHPELGTSAVAGLRAAIPRAGTFVDGEPGSEFVEPFVPRSGEFVTRGRIGGSGFVGSNLDAYLRNQGVTDVYLAGFALHVCIESTLRHGHDLGYRVHVLSDACSAFTAEQRAHVLSEVVHHFGDHLTVGEWADQVLASARVA